MQISLRRMTNGSWHWQTYHGKSPSMVLPGDVGGGIYNPNAVDYPCAISATEAALEWVEKKDIENAPKSPTP